MIMSQEPSPTPAESPLAGKVALIGGGSKGIGRACALRLAGAGADVAIAARNDEAGQAVAREVRALGRRATFIQADLSDCESARAMAAAAEAEFGGIDILVVSGAGGGPLVTALPFVDIDPLHYPDYLTGQLLTRLNAVGAVLPTMRSRGYGKIVLVTTDAGRVPTPGESMFGIAAAGLMFGVRAIAREIARFGVRLNAVSITVTTDTGTWEQYQTDSVPSEVLTRVFAKIEASAQFGVNSPLDVAEAVSFFASPASDQVSGAVLSVNGGVSFP